MVFIKEEIKLAHFSWIKVYFTLYDNFSKLIWHERMKYIMVSNKKFYSFQKIRILDSPLVILKYLAHL